MPDAGSSSARLIATSLGGGRKRLCLGIAAAPFVLWDELIELIRIGLAPLGFEVCRIGPAEVASRDWDGFLWLGNGDGLQAMADAVAAMGPQRPPTLLWQLDPLPPPDLPPELEEIGLRIARRDNHHFPAWCRLIVRRCVPFRRYWVRLIQYRDLRRMAGEGRSGREFAKPGAETVARVSRYWDFIRREVERGTLDQVAVSVPPRCEFLRRRGIPATVLPLGFHPSMGNDAGGRDGEPDGARDFDVVFLGAVGRTRRVQLLRQLGGELARSGIHLLVVGKSCYGARRARLLSRAKIVLNVNTVPWDMPGFRFLTAIGCGAMVVSEPIRDPSPFHPGRHYVETPVAQLPDTIRHYVRDDDGRSAIVAAARRFLQEEHTWEQSMLRLGNWFHVHSAVSTRGM